MREQLIGFLLGALDADEQQRVEQELEHNPALQAELECLQRCFEPLAADADPHEPPVGLATRTCHKVAQQASQRVVIASHEPLSGAHRWSLTDMAVMAGVCAAAVLLFFPAIVNSQFQASLAACQNNLRSVGFGLQSYADANGGYFPAIPAHGNLAAAGAYGPQLVDSGYITDPTLLRCPHRRWAWASSDADQSVPVMPTCEEIEQAFGRRLADLQKIMGGDYGYTLGYIENGKLHAIRCRGRENFPILADAPCIEEGARFSSNHGGRGQNVWFESGRVQWISSCKLGCGDDLYRNDAGYTEAGMHADDGVLGASNTPPIHYTRLEQ